MKMRDFFWPKRAAVKETRASVCLRGLTSEWTFAAIIFLLVSLLVGCIDFVDIGFEIFCVSSSLYLPALMQ